jgi:hypothetical protein
VVSGKSVVNSSIVSGPRMFVTITSRFPCAQENFRSDICEIGFDEQSLRGKDR